ncbi:MAG: hypothetical protein WC748_08210 [Legionellales bacterium]|jgi:hypothetical protein
MSIIYKNIKTWFEFYPPACATVEGWAEFEARFKSKAPIRYYLNEIKDFIECSIFGSIEKAIWWCKYRTIYRYHIINTRLKPGYHETDELILHSVFVLLQDFVEIQCAHKYSFLYPKRAKVLSCKRSGIAYLKCMLKVDENQHLKEPYQAVLQCYHYWTCERAQKMKAIDDAWEARSKNDLEDMQNIFNMENELRDTDSEYICLIAKYRQYMWT